MAAATAWGAQPKLDAAREAAERGRREYNLGRWQQAIEDFEKAYQLSGDAAFLFNLAQSHRQLGHNSEALRLYRAFLREKPGAENRGIAETQIKELEAQPVATAPPPVSAAPPVSGPPPAPPPAARPAAPPPVSKVEPAASPPPPPPPATPRPAAVPPSAALPPPAPPVATPAPSPAVSLSAAPPPRRTPLPRWVPIVGAGVTIALAAGAVVTGLSASSRFDDLRSSCAQTPAGCTADQIDGVKSRDRAATVLWVAAGVFAVATGVSFYVNAREAGASAQVRF